MLIIANLIIKYKILKLSFFCILAALINIYHRSDKLILFFHQFWNYLILLNLPSIMLFRYYSNTNKQWAFLQITSIVD